MLYYAIVGGVKVRRFVNPVELREPVSVDIHRTETRIVDDLRRNAFWNFDVDLRRSASDIRPNRACFGKHNADICRSDVGIQVSQPQAAEIDVQVSGASVQIKGDLRR